MVPEYLTVMSLQAGMSPTFTVPSPHAQIFSSLRAYIFLMVMLGAGRGGEIPPSSAVACKATF